MPLLIRAPGISKAGALCDTPVVSMDVYPTFRELAGLGAGSTPEDGLSLSRLLDDPAATLSKRDLYFHYPHYYPTTTPVSAIRSGPWKLLEYLDSGKTELFDLREDLGETNDLSLKLPDRARDLLHRLRSRRESVGARMPSPNPAYR